MVMVAEEDFTAAVEADSAVARREVSMAAEVTMATAADIPTSVTMEVATTVVMVGTAVTMEVATTVDTVVMAGMVVGMVATDGMADIGAIHTTVMDGAGDGVWLWVAVLGMGISVWLRLQPFVFRSYPDYYPYDCPPGYTCPPNGNDDPPPPNPSPESGSNPANPWRPPVSTPNKNYVTSNVATLSSRGPILSIDRITATPSNYQLAHSSTQQNPQVRPEVRRAMQALREMPPFARQREIETGRYSHFSAEEREILRSLDVKDKSEYSKLR